MNEKLKSILQDAKYASESPYLVRMYMDEAIKLIDSQTINPKCDICTAIACGDECDGMSNFTSKEKPCK